MSVFDFDPEEFDEAEVNRNLSSDNLGTRAEAIYQLARQAANDGNNSKSITMLETALEIFEKLNRLDGQRACLEGLSFLTNLENRKSSQEWMQKLARLNAEDLDSTAEVFNLWQLGQSYRKDKNWDNAANTFRQAASIARENNHPLLPNILAMLGRSLRKTGSLEESAAVLAEAGELFKMGEENWLPIAENDQALTLLKLGRFQQALDLATEALALAKFDENYWAQNKFEYTIAAALNGLGRHQDALDHLDEIKDRKHAHKRKHKMKIDLERVRALRGLGREAQAKDLMPGILAVCKRYELEEFEHEARVAMSEILMEQGEYLDAIHHLHRALEIGQDEPSAEDVHLRFLLAICFDATEQKGERIAQLEIIAGNALNIYTEGYALAIAELALHHAQNGSVEIAQTYIDAIDALPARNPFVLGRLFEAQGVLLQKAGSDVKANNQFMKAMRAYTEGNHPVDAANVAKRLPPLVA